MKIDRAALKESVSDTIIATPLNLLINYVFLALLMSLEFGPVLISVIMTIVFFVIAIVRKYYVRTWFKKRQSQQGSSREDAKLALVCLGDIRGRCPEMTLNSLWSLRYPSPEHEENCSLYHGDWRSLVAHSLWERRVVGSNPTSPTNFIIKEHYEFQPTTKDCIL